MPDDLVAAEPELFFRPQPSASGIFATWLGVHLDVPGVPFDSAEIAAIVEDAFRLVAPSRLVVDLDRR